MRCATPRAGGFGLLEVLGLLMVLAILAAVLAPATAAIGAMERIARAERDLTRLADAVIAFEDIVHHCPATVDQLVFPLDPGDSDLLGETFSNGERNRWDGPYYHLLPTDDGVQSAIGSVAGFRAIEVDPDVVPVIVVLSDVYEAAALDAAVDAGDGAGAGRIRWTGTVAVEIEYRVDTTCEPGGGPPGGGPPGGGPPGGGPPGGGPPGGGPPGGGPPGGGPPGGGPPGGGPPGKAP
jgi:type II secretory pathway pseudopilin PulG